MLEIKTMVELFVFLTAIVLALIANEEKKEKKYQLAGLFFFASAGALLVWAMMRYL